MIIKPYGFALWEKVQQWLDKKFKEDGVQNAYFPLFIPMSLLQKEKDHLEGFSPELAVVTHAGGEELSEPYAVRPTSETIMYQTYADWIQSYRDLPLKINQWCNVVRWEKRTYPFLRTSEFLWQEGHTVHRTDEEANEMALKALGWYRDFYEQVFAISPYVGIKSESERFAGAKMTYSIELVMPDGKALQAATSHNLTDNFSKVFNIEFLDENSQKQHAFQTSWGLSTRAIGGLILSHGDDSGLILPPEAASIQAVVIALGNKDEEKQRQVQTYAQEIVNQLENAGIRVKLDDSFKHSLGHRINEWELKGVPLRIELGAKEADSKSVTLVRRDDFSKQQISASDLASNVQSALQDIQRSLFEKSIIAKEQLTIEVENFEQFKQALSDKKMFLRALWCEDRDCEKQIKEQTKATTRVLEFEHVDDRFGGSCVHCGKKANRKWLFAQSY
jgi:prolyl-tRNA synthetase